MSDKIFIVAGTYQQYLNYKALRMSQNRPEDAGIKYTDFKYVQDVNTIRGCRPVHGVFIGTYDLRPDIEEIKLRIGMANT